MHLTLIPATKKKRIKVDNADLHEISTGISLNALVRVQMEI